MAWAKELIGDPLNTEGEIVKGIPIENEFATGTLDQEIENKLIRKVSDMVFNAKIEINSIQIKEIICNYLHQAGVREVNHQNIHFIIKEVEKGTQRDPWKEHEFQGVAIDNIQIGKGKFE